VLVICAPAFAAQFVVDSTADAIDSNRGDGVCATADGECTLRAAVMEANELAGADVIDLTAINDPESPIILTLEGVDESWIPAAAGSDAPCEAEILPNAMIGDLDITDDLEIMGAGPALWSGAQRRHAERSRQLLL
jgi:CSLREA domain-containing protein